MEPTRFVIRHVLILCATSLALDDILYFQLPLGQPTSARQRWHSYRAGNSYHIITDVSLSTLYRRPMMKLIKSHNLFIYCHDSKFLHNQVMVYLIHGILCCIDKGLEEVDPYCLMMIFPCSVLFSPTKDDEKNS